MLNPKTQERELAYLIKIDSIEPIVGSDNCEAAIVGGWRIMVRKNTFKPGDVAIYFEIDSQVPATEEFAFLASKHYKVKTQKYTFGGKGLMISQGLLMHPSDFGWESIKDGVIDSNNEMHIIGTSSQFLTKKLNVIYAMPDDNKRKAASADKYKLMAQRKPKIFKTKWAKWFMKRPWGRKFMFLLFGKKRDKKSSWPSWVVKTDEERIQNLVHMIPDFQKEVWIPTEKIDGTSTTFTMKRKPFNQNEFYVCSRNVVFDKPNKKCFYETNVYTEMAEKYHFENILKDLLNKNKDLLYVTIQGETYGSGIQNRNYSIKDHDLKVFNLIYGYKDGTSVRKNPMEMTKILSEYEIPCVPFFEPISLPGSCDKILALAAGESALDGLPREGLVFRSKDGKRSFKAVDNSFIMKFHS